jgi:hypothetical protein
MNFVDWCFFCPLGCQVALETIPSTMAVIAEISLANAVEKLCRAMAVNYDL